MDSEMQRLDRIQLQIFCFYWKDVNILMILTVIPHPCLVPLYSLGVTYWWYFSFLILLSHLVDESVCVYARD